MTESPHMKSAAPPAHGSGLPNPWSHFQRWRERRYERHRQELNRYLEAATPIALQAQRLYLDWRELVSEPIQDSQKAANRSATYWWHITEGLRKFEELTAPSTAARYHHLFGEAIRNATLGAEIVKSAFRSGNFSEVSRGLGHLDRYVELMARAEREMARLVRKYRLVEGE